MINEIFLGSVVIATSSAVITMPVYLVKLYRLDSEKSKALTDHNIVFCSSCTTYKYGSSSMCNECIITAASNLTGGNHGQSSKGSIRATEG